MDGTSWSLRATLRADFARDSDWAGERTGGMGARAAFSVRVQAVILVRLAHAVHRRSAGAGAVVKWFNQVLTGCDIAPAATIGPGLRLYHPSGVVVGPNAVIGTNCTLMQHVTVGAGRGGTPRLGDDVYVGPGAVLHGGCAIGDGAIVGANSVVDRDVPARAFAAGVPARTISVDGQRVEPAA